MKTFLITGGSGFLGINLARFLLTRGERVVSLDIAPFDYPEKDRVRVYTGDIRDGEAVRRAMAERPNIVVHCAAALPLYSKRDIYTTEVDGTRTVLQAAYDHTIPHVIHISSTAVYGAPDRHPLYEIDSMIGVGNYGTAKIVAEGVCNEFRKRGMKITILRPKSFIGPERLGVFALLYEWAYEGRNFPLIGDGANRYQLLDVEDLCAAIYQVATLDTDLLNDVFNIGAKDFGTMRSDYQTVLDHAGHGKRIIGFPARPVIFILRVLEWLRISSLYAWVYETAAKNSFVSIEKAKRILSFEPQYSNTDALIRNYDWYVAHRHTFQKQRGISHRMLWKEGILGLIKFFF